MRQTEISKKLERQKEPLTQVLCLRLWGFCLLQVVDMREQKLLASKVETLYKLGRNAEAEALAERLRPDA